MPGRPPKPTALHVVQGTARKCRMEKRSGELLLDPAAMPEAPAWMPAEARIEWDRLMSIPKYSKALSPADRGMLVTYCLIWDEIKRAVENYGGSENIQSARLTAFASIGAKLGLNPSDRVKLRTPEEPKQQNKFAKLGS